MTPPFVAFSESEHRDRLLRARAILLVPALAGLTVASGFSGHGFAMGPIAGWPVAELVVDGKPSLDLHGFRFSRFAEGALPEPRSVL